MPWPICIAQYISFCRVIDTPSPTAFLILGFVPISLMLISVMEIYKSIFIFSYFIDEVLNFVSLNKYFISASLKIGKCAGGNGWKFIASPIVSLCIPPISYNECLLRFCFELLNSVVESIIRYCQLSWLGCHCLKNCTLTTINCHFCHRSLVN